MIFGETPLEAAEGAILAHSVQLGSRRLRKGSRLSFEDVAALADAGLLTVLAARPEPGDVLEDEAALRVAAALAGPAAERGLTLTTPGSGSVSLVAARPGLVRIEPAGVALLNQLDEAVTVATLRDWQRVEAGQVVARVKVIPYAAPEAALQRVMGAASELEIVRVAPVTLRSAGLIVTTLPGTKPTLVEKGLESLRLRVARLGMRPAAEARVAHEVRAVSAAFTGTPGDLLLIMTASATSDRRDIGPAAVVAAGGRIERVGSPVDPGNLLFLAELAGRPIIGLPGSTRSPRSSGGDWVMERLACGFTVRSPDIAAMGVGGLLKEPQRMNDQRQSGQEVRVSAILLAAGRSTRMRGRDKLMEPVEGQPVLRRVAEVLRRSRAGEVIVVVGPKDDDRRDALVGAGVRIVTNPRPDEGLSSSIRTGLAAADPKADAALFALGDMPEVDARHVDALISAFDPNAGSAICRATTADGRPGHPVLFDRRFFDALSRLEGDRGARDLLDGNRGVTTLTPTPGGAAILDLDTPEDWEAWRSSRSEP